MPLPLNKRVKARAEEPEEEYDEYASDDSTVLVTGDDDNQILSSDAEDLDNDDNEDEDEDAQAKISNISFGTLSKAQSSLSKKRKRDQEPAHNDDKLFALRERLRQLREAKGLDATAKSASSKPQDSDSDNNDDTSGSDSDSDDQDGAPKSRSSKHAPGSQTSKRQVTRKRTVIDAPKRSSRDPRFGPLSGRPDDTLLQKNYAFLTDYQDSEISALKASIKATKSEDEKTELKRTLLSMESKKKAREAKERQQEVLRSHRKKEKEAIESGKNPFYLKRKDQKQLALVEKFNSMKGKDREKLIQRRQKKVAGKEKKMMPQARRIG